MATRIYGVSVGKTEFQITEGVGLATAANNIELTVDLGSSIVTDGNAPGGVRALKKQEVLDALQMIMDRIVTYNFPPA